MTYEKLFSPISLGTHLLQNRMVMAPMARLRAPDAMPNSTMREYYRQRASAGLIVTECVMVADTSAAYINAPGIYADKFVDGWREITDAVHQEGGKIFIQLWHTGRIAHASLMPKGMQPLAPSAIAGIGDLHTPTGKQPMSMPRALTVEEIKEIERAFGQAAEYAKNAGFDGAEIHGAYGYLVDQFIRDNSNKRNDEYGGRVENRSRFLLNVVAAVQQSFGRNVGVKLSPASRAYGISDSDPENTFGYILEQLDKADLAYVHMMEPLPGDDTPYLQMSNVRQFARQHYRGTLIANGGFSAESGEATLAESDADLISFGQKFIANPDLPARFKLGAAIASPDFNTVYGIPGLPLEQGYTDYPMLNKSNL